MTGLIVAILALLPAIVCAQSSQEPLGTLFYSAGERAAIVAARRDERGVATSSGASVSLSGVVKRGRQKSTAWINGQTVVEGQAVAAAGVPVINSGSVVFDGQPVRVRQSLDLESGARTDALPQGAVSVKRQK